MFNVIGQRELILRASWDCGSHPEAGKRGHIGEVGERPRSLHRKRKIRTSRRASALPGTTGRFRTTGLAATSCNVLEEPGHGVLSDILIMACRSLSLFSFHNFCVLSFLKSFSYLLRLLPIRIRAKDLPYCCTSSIQQDRSQYNCPRARVDIPEWTRT